MFFRHKSWNKAKAKAKEKLENIPTLCIDPILKISCLLSLCEAKLRNAQK